MSITDTVEHPSVYSQARTIDALVTDRAVESPDTPAVIDPASHLSYADLDRDSTRVAITLIDMGVGKGTRVGLLLPNSVDWATLAIAITRIGAVLVPLSTLLRPRELADQIGLADVEHLVCDDAQASDVAAELARWTGAELRVSTAHDTVARVAALPSLRRIWSHRDLTSPAAGTAQSAALDADRAHMRALASSVHPDDPFAVIFTSGSSGTPKGVRHTHRSVLHAVSASLTVRDVAPGTRLYLPMPLFWVGGLGTGLLSALVAGATLVTEARPRPASTLDLVIREQVNLFRGWPDQAVTLAEHAAAEGIDLSEWSASLSTGSLPALLPPHLRPEPGARANLFGMTETFGPYAGFTLTEDLPPHARGSCGRPLEGMTVRISDPRSGTALADGEIGEIWVRGPAMLDGICGRDRSEVFTADGFYRTGDLGRLTGEGFLFPHGRIDDMFKVSGATVYPGEVATVLRTLDAVAEAHVTAIEVDGVQRVGAVVVAESGAATPTEDDLNRSARELLSAFKVPSRWRIVSHRHDVPYGPTGKVDVAALRRMFSE